MSMCLNKEHSARAAAKLDLLKIVTIYLSVENKLQSADLLYILSQRRVDSLQYRYREVEYQVGFHHHYIKVD